MTSKFVHANNIRFHYVEEGTGPLVILLHGFPEFWYGWKNQIPALSKNYRVVVPDMRGFNLSEKPKGIANYNIKILADDIAALIKVLGEEKAILVGHDWGGAVAWAVASLYPKMISKLGILNVPYPSEMKKALLGFNLRQLRRSYYMFLFQLPLLPERAIGKNLQRFFERAFGSFAPAGKQPNITGTDIKKYVEAYSHPGALTAALNYYRAAFRYPGLFKKQKLPMPVLMLWGEHDVALGKELTINTHQYCDNLQLFYDPTSGHFIQHDNPGWVNEKLLAFFAQ